MRSEEQAQIIMILWHYIIKSGPCVKLHLTAQAFKELETKELETKEFGDWFR